MQEKLKLIAQHYGYDSQSRQLDEEIGELLQAKNKLWRSLNAGTEVDAAVFMRSYFKLCEEIADVENCLAQIKYLLGCEETVEFAKEAKINRQIARMEKGQ